MGRYDFAVGRTYGLANLMCEAARLHLFTTVLVMNDKRVVDSWKKGWAGGKPSRESRGDIFGPLKAAELALGDISSPFSMTPLEGSPIQSGYWGGIRRVDDNGYHIITTCSAWSQMCDALVALPLNYATTFEVRLHHVGFRYPTEEAMLARIKYDEEEFGTQAIFVPALDHKRAYIPVKTAAAPNGMYWVEHQFFPDGPRTSAIHWDLVTQDAEGLLSFVAGNLGVQAETWPAGHNDPIGVVWQMNSDGVEYGVMTRPRWWQIS